MKKKIFTLLLTTVFCFSLVACSGAEDSQKTTTKKVKAHDEENVCGIGDKVRIVETRKLSKDKNWRVAEIIEKAK